MPSLDISLLGQFSCHDEEPLQGLSSSTRLQSLLGYLLLHREAPVPRDVLGALLWPDAEEARLKGNFRRLLHRLRKSFPQWELHIDIQRQSILWRADSNVAVDVAWFLELYERFQESGSLEDAELTVEAYKGALLPACDDEWVHHKRRELQEFYLQALFSLADLYVQRRMYEPARQRLLEFLAEEPYREDAHRSLIRVLLLAGERVAAKEHYERYVEMLAGLDLVPDEELEDMMLRVDEQEPLSPDVSHQAQLIGRVEVWSQLLATWQSAQQSAQVLVLYGESGVGKSMLVRCFVEWLQKQAVTTLNTCCYPLEQDVPFTPIVSWFRAQALPSLRPVWRQELGRILPELHREGDASLDTSASATQEEDWQKHRMFEAIAHTILRLGEPLVLCLDDLQYCDIATLESLHYLLLRFAQHRPLLLLATLRTSTSSWESLLAKDVGWGRLLASLQRAGRLSGVCIDALSLDDAATLATSQTSTVLSPDWTRKMYQETRGNPLHVLEYAKAFASTVDDMASDNPRDLTQTLQHRLSQFDEDARTLLRLAAILGREFSCEVLLQMCDGVLALDIAADALDTLVSQEFLQETRGDLYQFAHQQWVDLLYEENSRPKRVVYHLKAAKTLEEYYQHELASHAATIARHYQAGGKRDKARAYYQRAIKHARRTFATEIELTYYPMLLPLLAPKDAVLLRYEWGQAHERLGQWKEAKCHYLEGFEQARGEEYVDGQAHSLLLQGTMAAHHYQLEDATSLLMRAKGLFESLDDDEGLGRVFGKLAMTCFREQRFADAEAYCQRQMALAKTHDDEMQFLDASGYLAKVYDHTGRASEAVSLFWQRWQVAMDAQQLDAVANTLINIGNTYRRWGAFAEAKQCYCHGLALTSEIRHRVGTFYAITNAAHSFAIAREHRLAGRFFQVSEALASWLQEPIYRTITTTFLAQYAWDCESEKAFQTQVVPLVGVTSEALYHSLATALEGREQSVNAVPYLFLRDELAHRYGHIDSDELLVRWQALLANWPGSKHHALLYYQRWRWDGDVDAGQRARELLKEVCEASYTQMYANHYEVLTGERILPPLTLPPLPAVLEGHMDMESLLTGLEDLM